MCSGRGNLTEILFLLHSTLLQQHAAYLFNHDHSSAPRLQPGSQLKTSYTSKKPKIPWRRRSRPGAVKGLVFNQRKQALGLHPH
ncbi:hypothetical protein BZA05DRAFT_393290 [Tricharina praecox]|uniref:uncharacterized protein n=1 Tax=Tricharina praecox TaxID=43433 RepID=UPI00221F0AA9|nr:uncharacterized protein BZA05DRAFT_393290 [Tricharina praecox]KAI5854127.1 hypothetical protein BZA05DRAFT_393290 [Tricharina praecox]